MKNCLKNRCTVSYSLAYLVIALGCCQPIYAAFPYLALRALMKTGKKNDPIQPSSDRIRKKPEQNSQEQEKVAKQADKNNNK